MVGFSRNSKVIRITQLESSHFEFMYMEINEAEEIESNKKSLTVRKGELRVMQSLLEVGVGRVNLVRDSLYDGVELTKLEANVQWRGWVPWRAG